MSRAISGSFHVEPGAEDFRRDLRDDGVPEGMQRTHERGNPISQQGNSGLNTTDPSVVTNDPAFVAAKTWRGSWSIRERPFSRVVDIPGVSFQSRADAVTHIATARGNPETITLMGLIDGTSWHNDRPAGVSDAFQVSEHSVEPTLANR